MRRDAPTNAYARGVLGEERALAFLEARGMTLLARRVRTPEGEIDLMLMDGDTLVLAEVKLRSRGGTDAGLFAVDARKRRRLARSALWVLSQMDDAPAAVRVDVVAVGADGVAHIPNAVTQADLGDDGAR